MTLFDFFTPKSETYFLYDNITIRQALEKFDYHKFSVVPLISQDGQYITTVSEGDILRCIKNTAGFDVKAAENIRISEIEKYRAYKACSHNTDLRDIIRLAMDQNFVPIVDDRNLFIGIVKRKEILTVLYNQVFTEA